MRRGPASHDAGYSSGKSLKPKNGKSVDTAPEHGSAPGLNSTRKTPKQRPRPVAPARTTRADIAAKKTVRPTWTGSKGLPRYAGEDPAHYTRRLNDAFQAFQRKRAQEFKRYLADVRRYRTSR